MHRSSGLVHLDDFLWRLVQGRVLVASLGQESVDALLELGIYPIQGIDEHVVEADAPYHSLGMTSSSFRGTRLKGSFASESK